MEICEAFSVIAELALKDGVDSLPVGEFWDREVGPWHISLNRDCDTRRNSDGMKVPAFSAALKFNGFPAGIIDPRGGIIAAGSLANEDTFIAAIKAEIERLPQHHRRNLSAGQGT